MVISAMLDGDEPKGIPAGVSLAVLSGPEQEDEFIKSKLLAGVLVWWRPLMLTIVVFLSGLFFRMRRFCGLHPETDAKGLALANGHDHFRCVGDITRDKVENREVSSAKHWNLQPHYGGILTVWSCCLLLGRMALLRFIFALLLTSAMGHLDEDNHNSLSFVDSIGPHVENGRLLVIIRDEIRRVGEHLALAESNHHPFQELGIITAELLQKHAGICEQVETAYHDRSQITHTLREKLRLNENLATQGGSNAANFIRSAQKNAMDLHSEEKIFEEYVTAKLACDRMFTILQHYETRLGEMRSLLEDSTEL